MCKCLEIMIISCYSIYTRKRSSRLNLFPIPPFYHQSSLKWSISPPSLTLLSSIMKSVGNSMSKNGKNRFVTHPQEFFVQFSFVCRLRSNSRMKNVNLSLRLQTYLFCIPSLLFQRDLPGCSRGWSSTQSSIVTNRPSSKLRNRRGLTWLWWKTSRDELSGSPKRPR